MLKNYLAFETPDEALGVKDREAWLEASAAVPDGLPPLKVVGKLDRLDDLGGPDGLRVVDYKTGQAPTAKRYYSNQLKEELADRALFQLRVYAWLLSRRGVDARELRLLYLGGEEAVAVDEALPADAGERREALDNVEAELGDVWRAIHDRVAADDPTAFKRCDRKWCFCHVARPLCLDEPAPAADAPAAPDAVPIAVADDLAALNVRDLRDLCRTRDIDAVVKRGQDVRATLLGRLRGEGERMRA